MSIPEVLSTLLTIQPLGQQIHLSEFIQKGRVVTPHRLQKRLHSGDMILYSNRALEPQDAPYIEVPYSSILAIL